MPINQEMHRISKDVENTKYLENPKDGSLFHFNSPNFCFSKSNDCQKWDTYLFPPTPAVEGIESLYAVCLCVCLSVIPHSHDQTVCLQLSSWSELLANTCGYHTTAGGHINAQVFFF